MIACPGCGADCPQLQGRLLAQEINRITEGCDGPQSAERACVKRPTPDPRSGSGRPLIENADLVEAAARKLAEYHERPDDPGAYVADAKIVLGVLR